MQASIKRYTTCLIYYKALMDIAQGRQAYQVQFILSHRKLSPCLLSTIFGSDCSDNRKTRIATIQYTLFNICKISHKMTCMYDGACCEFKIAYCGQAFKNRPSLLYLIMLSLAPRQVIFCMLNPGLQTRPKTIQVARWIHNFICTLLRRKAHGRQACPLVLAADR